MTKASIHISVNKRRLTIQAILFTILALGALMGLFTLAENFDNFLKYIFQGAGIVFCLFLFIAAGAKLKKRSDKNAGLTVNNEGILDNSSDLSLGLIKWKDIKKIDREESLKSDLLIIQVKKQTEYIRKAKNAAIERLLRQNMRQFETPVVIDPAYLAEELEGILDKIDQYKKL